MALRVTPILVMLILVPSGTLAHTPAGTPKPYCEGAADWKVHEYLPSPRGEVMLHQDGNPFDCDGDGVPTDYDGHTEFAVGGALLDGAHHGNRICVADLTGLPVGFSVNDAPYVGGCAVVTPASEYTVVVHGGWGGHIFTD